MHNEPFDAHAELHADASALVTIGGILTPIKADSMAKVRAEVMRVFMDHSQKKNAELAVHIVDHAEMDTYAALIKPDRTATPLPSSVQAPETTEPSPDRPSTDETGAEQPSVSSQESPWPWPWPVGSQPVPGAWAQAQPSSAQGSTDLLEETDTTTWEAPAASEELFAPAPQLAPAPQPSAFVGPMLHGQDVSLPGEGIPNTPVDSPLPQWAPSHLSGAQQPAAAPSGPWKRPEEETPTAAEREAWFRRLSPRGWVILSGALAVLVIFALILTAVIRSVLNPPAPEAAPAAPGPLPGYASTASAEFTPVGGHIELSLDGNRVAVLTGESTLRIQGPNASATSALEIRNGLDYTLDGGTFSAVYPLGSDGFAAPFTQDGKAQVLTWTPSNGQKIQALGDKEALVLQGGSGWAQPAGQGPRRLNGTGFTSFTAPKGPAMLGFSGGNAVYAAVDKNAKPSIQTRDQSGKVVTQAALQPQGEQKNVARWLTGPSNAHLAVIWQEDSGTYSLSIHDVATGKQTARASLPMPEGVADPKALPIKRSPDGSTLLVGSTYADLTAGSIGTPDAAKGAKDLSPIAGGLRTDSVLIKQDGTTAPLPDKTAGELTGISPQMALIRQGDTVSLYPAGNGQEPEQAGE
ncbi:MAG: hypothetical protein LBE25_09390 [Arthrobacter sp.]|jgi:hypothetical protein|nr:hypothetical protein [Arthrobacter sp.]